MSAGVGLVRDRIASLAEDCPHTRVVLAGYSQGAAVVHRAAATLSEPTLAAVVLMGDPQRNPRDTVETTSLGTGTLAGRGNGGVGAAFPAALSERVLEVCAHGDDVCNAPAGGRVGPPSATHHSAYKDRATQRRIAREVDRLAVSAGN